jgi:hypothetical protein
VSTRRRIPGDPLRSAIAGGIVAPRRAALARLGSIVLSSAPPRSPGAPRSSPSASGRRRIHARHDRVGRGADRTPLPGRRAGPSGHRLSTASSSARSCASSSARCAPTIPSSPAFASARTSRASSAS